MPIACIFQFPVQSCSFIRKCVNPNHARLQRDTSIMPTAGEWKHIQNRRHILRLSPEAKSLTPAYPACSTIVVTSLPPTIFVLNISGTGASANTPSSSPSTGRLTLIALHLAVVISTSRQSFER